MRLKKKYTALVVAIMLVATGILASFVLNSVQGSRIAYVSVSADKSSYSVGENVTFQLAPLSNGIQFTVSGSGPGEGVHIIRVPDSVSIDDILGGDSQMFYNITTWERDHPSTIIPIPEFNTTGEPLELSWNGTVAGYDWGGNGIAWGKATAGYYVLYPMYHWSYGHSVKFMLDRSSFFYYDSLAAKFTVTEGTNITIDVDLTLLRDEAATVGNLTSFIPGSYTMNYSEGFHNFTVDLNPGETTRVTISYRNTNQYLAMYAVLRTPERTYVFGMLVNYYYYNNGRGLYVVQY